MNVMIAIWNVISMIAMYLVFVHIVCDFIKELNGNENADSVYHNLLPIAWVGSLIVAVDRFSTGILSDHGSIWDFIFGFMYLYLAKVYYKEWKDDDDKRWKKRFKKLAGKVKDLGHRLVVVPDPNPV